MFEDDASRSTAMSLILSLVFRNLLDTVPMHIITAPTPGSGKSELANAAVRIAFNADASAGGKGADEVELGKRLETLLSSGVQYILLDNVTGGLKGDVLCQAITQIEMQFRRLGSHTSVNVRGGRPIIATGNNLAVEEDIVRRSLRIGLDTNLERPEARTFKYDLRTFIRDKRPELLAAALTIGRAFILAAQKDRTLVLPAKPSGFTEWSAFVRSPLVWLGMADPVQTQVGLAAEDPAREVLAGVLRAWHLLSKGEPCTLADILKLSSNVLDTEAEEQDRVDRELALEKFKAACPNVKNGDLKSALGYYLRRHQNSPAAGLRISIADRDRANTTRWQTTDI